MIRTRFAPSPTGFLHIGSARTALFCWAYAKKNNGTFILRIEDTDIERSTQNSLDSILSAMKWLGLEYNEGPYYQTKRMERYKKVIQTLLKSGHAYYCYCSKEELDQMREKQKARGLKPKYDRRCLNSTQHHKLGVSPVVRFKTPQHGAVMWNDMAKGYIEVNNSELDDLIIARSDGTPTYNLCVVVDDFDMQISLVIRGDDHVNNTPRQINILKALGSPIPTYAHVPMILREDGHKMSKRTDAVGVMQYKDMGILPEALLNYLARLCWSHGNDEIFSLSQFVNWFNLDDVSGSAARFDIKKLHWVNAEHIKMVPDSKIAQLVLDIWITANKHDLLTKVNEYLSKKQPPTNELIQLEQVVQLVKNRGDNLIAIAAECAYFYIPKQATDEDIAKYLHSEALVILAKFATLIEQITSWDLDTIKLAIKEFCANNNIKMPQLGMPLRLKLCGTTHTPSFDKIIHLLGKAEVLKRLNP